MDEDRVGELGLFAAQDGLDGRMGDVADHALLRALGVDAEAAGGEPEVSFVVKDHGQEILLQRLAQRGLRCRLDVDIQHLFKLRQYVSGFIRRAQHQHVVVAGGADDAVFRIQKGVGALNQIAAAVVLLRGEVSEGFRFLRVQIADGDAAEQRNDRVAVAVKVNGG